MKLTRVKPAYRCKKCGAPLTFDHNECMERDAAVEKAIEARKKAGWLKGAFINYWDFIVDAEIQYWHCPKCFEEYIVSLKDEEQAK